MLEMGYTVDLDYYALKISGSYSLFVRWLGTNESPGCALKRTARNDSTHNVAVGPFNPGGVSLTGVATKL